MAPGRARDERKERQWQRRIEQWRASGLSVRAFCARHGLATASFYNWRRVLQRRVADEPAFVAVRVVADAVSTRTSALEVVLTDGRTVRVTPGLMWRPCGSCWPCWRGGHAELPPGRAHLAGPGTGRPPQGVRRPGRVGPATPAR